MQHQQFEDAERVHESHNVAFGAEKSTFERQNVENGNRDDLDNPIDAELDPGPLEMQDEQIEEIVAIVGKMKVQSEHSYLKIKTRETRISE
jgi:hypothetical protein